MRYTGHSRRPTSSASKDLGLQPGSVASTAAGYAIGKQFAVLSIAALVITSCSRPVPDGSILLTQLPRSPSATANDVLDLRYPSGSRVVTVEAPLSPGSVRVLSQGLLAAGAPVISCDGRTVVFVAKAAAATDWQIYQAQAAGGQTRAVTSIPGGAMQPALLPDGSILFVSPVPKLGDSKASQPVPELYVQAPGGKPRQLTFLPAGASDPTVLEDGRILFVSKKPPGGSESDSNRALYTINNDGTEIAAFAGQHEQVGLIERPRQLSDGRVLFVSSSPDGRGNAGFFRMARPFQGHFSLFPNLAARVRSIEPAGGTNLLVCAENSSSDKNPRCHWPVYRPNTAGTSLGQPFFEDPSWDSIEAVPIAPHIRPMGRLSTMDPAKQTGQILCLDINFTTYHSADEKPATATRVRVLAGSPSGAVRTLGEVPVQADGSFMAEVPADVALGFEALDQDGKVVRKLESMVWVRPGENRACLGCHEPHNQAPHNHRPLAVRVPVPRLGAEDPKLAQKTR